MKYGSRTQLIQEVPEADQFKVTIQYIIFIRKRELAK
jgi:hypothetical protein